MTKHQKTQVLKTEKPEMKPKAESPALPTVQPVSPETVAQFDADIAALAAEARELTDDIRVGDDLRFKKEPWTKTIGDKEIGIGATATFAVDTRSYKRGWIKWVDRKPVFKMIGRPIDGFVSPLRSQLPDRDDLWPRDARGVPEDPWQENFSIVMRDLSDGRLCTWTTTSWFGQKALGRLLDTYVRNQKKHPDLMPVVLLGSEMKPTTNYGDVAAPVLTVVDWQPFGPEAAPPGMPNLPPPPLPPVQEVLPPKAIQQSLGKEMEDDIPY
jgi:hypothetical protein